MHNYMIYHQLKGNKLIKRLTSYPKHIQEGTRNKNYIPCLGLLLVVRLYKATVGRMKLIAIH